MALTRPKYSNIVDGDYKNSCRVATTTNINLNSAPLTYDGVTFSKGDRVLVTAQSVGSQNGIYIVLDEGTGSNGTWTRSFDSNDGTRLSGGSQTSTGEGSYAGAIWRLVTPDPIVIGTTPLVWATGSAFAGGANKQVQYNDNGVLAGTPIIQIDEITGNVVIGVGAVQLDSNNSNYGSAVVVGGLAVQKGISIATHLNVESGPVYANSLNTANARITGGSITGVTGAFTTLQVQNFSAANIYQSTTGTLVAENFSSGNIYQSAADTFVVTNLSASNVYQTTAQSIQSPNVQIGTNWGTLSRANLAVGNVASLHATEGNITTLSAPNFSSANIYQVGVGQSIQTANAQIGDNWGDTSRANLAVANVRVLNATTGNVKTLVADNFSSANIYQSAADTFVASNFSSPNARVTSGSLTGVTGAYTTLQASNFSSANIYQSAADTFVATNFSTTNVRATSGSLTGVTGAFTTLQADNFSSPNVRVIGGSLTGVTGAYTTLQVDNFSSANIYQSAAGTLVVTNFSSGNIYQSAAGTFVATNFSTGNLYQSRAGTLVSDNFSSANARVTSGYADNFPIGANTRAPGSFTTLQAFSDSAVYANLTVSGNLTIFGNITTVGTTDLSVTDSIINLHTAANLTAWTVNDGRDIGVKMHYYDTEDSHAFVGRDNATGFLEWITRGTEGVGNVFTGTLGTIRTGEYIAANNTPSTSTTTGAVRVTGGVGISNGLYVNGTSWFQNASTANAIVTGGSVTGTTGAFTKLVVTDFSSANIYQSAADTFVVTNLSAANLFQTTAQSIQSPNVQIGTNWGSLSRANLVVGNIQVLNATTGNVTTLSAPNFSSANIYQTGVSQSLQTANAQIGDNWGDTSRANLAVGNVRVLNATTGNIRTLVADNFSAGNTTIVGTSTLYAANFSSPNVQMSGGQITASGTVQPSANGTVNLGTSSSYWNNHYAVTAFHNTVTVGAGGVTTTDGNITATSAQTSFGNLNITGNIYQNNIQKRAIQYTTGATPHSPAQPGDQWFDTATDVLYVYHDDGSTRFWLDMIGQVTPINYTASGTPPAGPRNGDLWYDTSSSILYTRVDDGDSEAWIDFSSQASPIAVNSIDSIIQPINGGTGLSFLPNALIKGNGTEPITAAVAGIDYIAPQANGVLISGNIEVGNAIVADTLTVGTVSAHNLYWDGLFQGPNGTFDALTVAGNVTVGNILVNDDIVTLGNITGNNIITTVNLVYSGNISYDGNLNVLNINATNVALGAVPGVSYIDATATIASYADTATVDFANFSGMLLVTNCTSGTTVMFLCGGQSATAIGASKLAADFGTVTYNAGINGYTWTNNTGSTIDASFQATKTRGTA